MIIPNNRLKIEDVLNVAKGEKVLLSEEGIEKVSSGRRRLEELLKRGAVIYGVNTGFGALQSRKVADSDLARLQENLIISHSLGQGEIFSPEVVRGALFLRANCLAKGLSGVRPELIRFLLEILNRRITPVVYKKGSVGASGDLLPLAAIGLVVIGRGEVFYKKRRMKAGSAFKREGLAPLKLAAKEGLSLINGTEMTTSYLTFSLFHSLRLWEIANIAAALSFFALGGDIGVFDKKLHQLKPYPGQILTARLIRRFLKGACPKRERVQDPYSLRCVPQVHGSCYEALRFCEGVVRTEINSVTDNPIITKNGPLTGGNFHAQSLALAGDILSIALTTLSLISERRIFLLSNPAHSKLPPFLIKENGLNSGFMMAQVLAAAQAAENKSLSFPASITSLPTSANQEDFVSMSMQAVEKAEAIRKNLEGVLTIELILACQAIELQAMKMPKRLKRIFKKVREYIPFLDRDREISEGIRNLTAHIYELLENNAKEKSFLLRAR